MHCSLFGKLGAKRDFIALVTPRRFLEMWEPWIQACMSASRHQLGAQWQNAFLTAPVWRFWLGADISGTTVVGAIMPSVDGVGRYYPLTLLAMADPSHSVPPPDLNAQDQWFTAAEEFLLSTLDQAKSFDEISTALDAMPTPLAEASVRDSAEVLAIGDTMVGTIAAGKRFQDSLLKLRHSNHESSAAASFWWTEGGGNFPPMALCSRGMPDPFRYSIMLTGIMAGNETASAS
jgi:type VI secretion system protein ImpM